MTREQTINQLKRAWIQLEIAKREKANELWIIEAQVEKNQIKNQKLWNGQRSGIGSRACRRMGKLWYWWRQQQQLRRCCSGQQDAALATKWCNQPTTRQQETVLSSSTNNGVRRSKIKIYYMPTWYVDQDGVMYNSWSSTHKYLRIMQNS